MFVRLAYEFYCQLEVSRDRIGPWYSGGVPHSSAQQERPDPFRSAGRAGPWHVQDSGRGLRYEHFTQNEDVEKLAKPNLVIGKFGVGLKDAMATFDRHNISVLIQSKFADITIESVSKHGFEDVLTLHAAVALPSNRDMTGTEFILSGLTRDDVDRAKDFFLIYSGDVALEGTRYGQVLKRSRCGTRPAVRRLVADRRRAGGVDSESRAPVSLAAGVPWRDGRYGRRSRPVLAVAYVQECPCGGVDRASGVAQRTP